MSLGGCARRGLVPSLRRRPRRHWAAVDGDADLVGGRSVHHLAGLQAVEHRAPPTDSVKRFGPRRRTRRLPGRHADQPVTIGARDFQGVQVAHHGHARNGLIDALQGVHDDARVARIERGDRLVGQDQARTLHQRPGDGDALLLAARQAVGPLRRQGGDVELLQGRERHRDIGRTPQAQQRARRRHGVEAPHQDVVEDVELAHEVELLEDHGAAGAPVAQLAAAQGGDVGPVEGDGAGAGLDEAVNHAQQRRLAGARPPHDADEAALGDVERDVVHGRLAAEATAHALDDQHRSIPQGRIRVARIRSGPKCGRPCREVAADAAPRRRVAPGPVTALGRGCEAFVTSGPS